MLDKKSMGWVHIVGALVAGWFGWSTRDWGVLVLALVVLISGISSVSGK